MPFNDTTRKTNHDSPRNTIRRVSAEEFGQLDLEPRLQKVKQCKKAHAASFKKMVTDGGPRVPRKKKKGTLHREGDKDSLLHLQNSVRFSPDCSRRLRRQCRQFYIWATLTRIYR